jgi:hypothetical protein
LSIDLFLYKCFRACKQVERRERNSIDNVPNGVALKERLAIAPPAIDVGAMKRHANDEQRKCRYEQRLIECGTVCVFVL